MILLCAALFFLSFAGMSFAKEEFKDVPKTHWAYDAVDYLLNKGLIEGYPDGTFKGERTMTSYEFAQVIARAYVAMEEKLTNGEKASIDTEAIMNDLMEEFAPELDAIKKLSEENKAKLDDLESKLKENSDKDAELAAKLEKLGSKFKFNGQLKLRANGKYMDAPGNPRVQAPKISFRFDLEAPVNDEITFKGRLGTGGVGTNNASETTLTGIFGTKAFDLERAYLEWKPAAWPEWKFTCGKFRQNWVSPWNFVDVDMNVEGLEESYKGKNWNVNIAEMIPADKGGYIVGQIGEQGLFVKNLEAYLSYHFVSPGAFETLYTGYPYWFRVDDDNYSAVELYGKYNFEYSKWPILLEAAYRQSLMTEAAGAKSALNQAAMAQVTVGKIKEVNDYDIYLNYARILPNAIIPQLADSTNGVDHDTWTFGIDYKLQPNTLLKLRYVNAQNIMVDPDGGFDYVCADILCDF